MGNSLTRQARMVRRYARCMKLSGGRDVEAGGLTGRLYASVASVASVSSGARKTYVLLHGIGVSYRYFSRLHRELALTADVYTFDLPGLGDAPRPPPAGAGGGVRGVHKHCPGRCRPVMPWSARA
jgi:pimeloyl-ACP methyl ester carboxylesterase